MAKVAFMQLASCWGCHQSLLDAHLTLLHVLPELEIVYWPAVVDFKLKDLENYEDKSIDFGFLEGFCRTEADKANVLLMRKKCKVLVAMGSCAVLGGAPGMANLFSIEELTERKFMDTTYVDEGSKIPDQHVPKFLPTIPDIHTVTNIDVDLPGCPPRTGNIVGLIAAVLGQIKTKTDPNKSMCDVCPLKSCLLDEGKICFGSITAAAEELGPITKGYPVLGDYGLSLKVKEDRAKQLIELINEKTLSKKEVQQTAQALMMFMSSIPLGFLASKADPLLKLKMDPDAVLIKKIEHPTKPGKSIEVVDYTAAGYPELVNDVIGVAMAELKENPEFDESAKTVCSECERNLVDKEVIRYKRDYEGFPDMDTCLLVQGYVCMGPLTKGGCGATCIRANSPCLGCYGPALNVDDVGSKALSFFPAICRDDPENIKKFFKDPAGLFNRFTVPTSGLHNRIKDTDM